mmetsp:Transcript_25584/g.37966  ORF Transcript_25584/g.37966 Transcript_25584/m.37966 type:complete len:224 (-) Transcript_25584:232-903(-)
MTNYTQLPKVIEAYSSRGFEVLAFPCNQFNYGEKGSGEKSRKIFDCKKDIVWFENGEVNGANTREIFSFLKRELPGRDGSNNIRWNFSKFLIDSEGKPYKRYGPTVEPNGMVEGIEYLLTLKETKEAQEKAMRMEEQVKELTKKAKIAAKEASGEEKKASREGRLQKKASERKFVQETRLNEAEEKIREMEKQIEESEERAKNARRERIRCIEEGSELDNATQ